MIHYHAKILRSGGTGANNSSLNDTLHEVFIVDNASHCIDADDQGLVVSRRGVDKRIPLAKGVKMGGQNSVANTYRTMGRARVRFDADQWR
jgi:hypothetical protein